MLSPGKVLYDPAIMDACRYTLTQTNREHNTRIAPMVAPDFKTEISMIWEGSSVGPMQAQEPESNPQHSCRKARHSSTHLWS